MSNYHNIKIDHNSDCWGELDVLKALLKQNKGFLPKDYSNREIIEIAVNELYDRLVAEKKSGVNQRRSNAV